MSFVSATELDSKRQQRKQQRRLYHEEILKEARDKFIRQRKVQEEREKRGDDKWVAPGVSSRLSLGDGEVKRKNKKKHHHKIKKAHKKRKIRGNKESDHSDSSNSSDAVWVEQPTSLAPIPIERDNWMTEPLPPSMATQSQLAEIATISTSKRKGCMAKDVKLQCFDQPGQHHKELNPYWKDGGKGLPTQEESHLGEGFSYSSTVIGDGGRSWLQQSYKRVLERAEEEGRTIEELATERWGSIEKLYSLLHSAGIDPSNPDKQPAWSKKDYFYSRSSHKRGYRDDERVRRCGNRERESKQRAPEDRDYDHIDLSSVAFMKPGEEGDNQVFKKRTAPAESSGWQKKQPNNSSCSKLLFPTVTSQSVHSQTLANEPPSVQCDCPPVGPTATSKQVSDEQLNSTAAKLMKAEMMENVQKVEQLKKQLEELRKLQQQQQTCISGMVELNTREAQEEIILLTKTDRFGHIQPVNLSLGKLATKSRAVSTHSGKGKRRKYFADDDDYSLRQLMEQERFLTAEETQSAIARMATKFVPAANTDDTMDDVMDSKISVKHNPEKESERRRQKAIAESKKMSAVLENCRFCFDNAGFEKHLLIAMGIDVYLAAPSCQSLVDGHCLLVPVEHTVSSMLLDENVWSEIEIFRKGLTAMFAKQEKDAVFMETYTSTKRKAHMFIECIPIPKDVGELAPMYFKKAILESDEEWSDNHKVIDTSKKGVRSSLPAGLPYFFVEFGTDGGFAHIIENIDKFPHYFGKEVCGGMLDVEPRLWLKPPRENFDRQKEKVTKLSEWWSPFDWTQKLKNTSE